MGTRKFTAQLSGERWKRGGQRRDTVLRAPTFLAAGKEMVYVLDRDPHAVVAFRLSDGSTAWHSDTMGLAFGVLRDVAVRPNGEVAVLDDKGFIHRVSPTGEWRTSIPLQSIENPHTMCVPDDSSFILYTLEERADPIVRIDTLGRILRRYPFPWPDLRKATSIERQSHLASSNDGACIVALHFGRGFAIMRDDSVILRQPYVEAMQLPKVKVTTWDVGGQQAKQIELPRNQPSASVSITVRDSMILMLFAGLTKDRYRMLDTHDATTGSYRGSWRLPISSRAVTMAPGTVLVIGMADGYPALLAITTP